MIISIALTNKPINSVIAITMKARMIERSPKLFRAGKTINRIIINKNITIGAMTIVNKTKIIP